MPIARDPVPTIRDWPRLTSYLERTLQAIEAWVERQEEWDRVAQSLFSVGAYASVFCDDVSDGNIGTGWQPIDFFETELVTPRGVVLGLNGQFTFPYEGVYRLSLSGSLEHNEVNSGRVFNLRLYNVTTATAGTALVVPTGRNSPGTPVNYVLVAEVGAANVGDTYRFEYGGTTDAYTSVNWSALALGINMVSEFRGTMVEGF